MGETLIEVIFSLVIIGVIVSVFFAAIATTSNATKAHRDLVTADAVLRDYAEAAKHSVRTDCKTRPTGSAFTVAYTPPAGFGVSATGLTCPAVTTTGTVAITATMPNTVQRTLSIAVRTP
jgi:type II secretory pathway pseudopilin PulG